MAYKTILVHLDGGARTADRVSTAATLALRHGAHLVGVAPTGWIPVPYNGIAAGELLAYEEAATRQLRQQAEACVQAFRAQVERLGLPSHESRVEAGYAGDSMCLAARYGDLTVVTQVDPAESHALQSPMMAQDVLMQSGRPLLVLPHAGDCSLPASPRVLVAWNAGREAARAVVDAMPLLQAAAAVDVVVFEPPDEAQPRHGALPGADIGQWLARHGVAVAVDYVPIKVDAGEALLSYAADTGARLIVAGGYGHSRLREAVLGGVTRTLMSSAPVPVLLSH